MLALAVMQHARRPDAQPLFIPLRRRYFIYDWLPEARRSRSRVVGGWRLEVGGGAGGCAE